MPSELRFFRQFLKTCCILFFIGELDAAPNFFYTDWLIVLNHYPNFAVIQCANHFDQLFFRFGQYHILFRLHFFHLQTKKLRQYKILPQPFFCVTTKPPCPSRGCKEAKSIPVGLLTCVSNNSLSAFSRLSSMTDFRQRQAISTLTAPAARGLTPHYLVQLDARHALHPATGTFIKLPNYYNPRLLKMQ